MDIFQSMKISSSALQAQQIRLNTISSNLANIETTRTPEGGPYRKKSVIFRTVNQPAFDQQLASSLQEGARGVEVARITTDNRPPKTIYDPSHPDADSAGYVAFPDINLLEEIADLMSATRTYEANVTVIKSAKRMALKALDIGK
ncbi:MAG: flagellar basal body rod protein FlgC [Deltaproteobacteria bacterium RIFOXYD12_FULL_57_12]|nr:MAG: flagellar basal body rod protein FlgC [Deltaproteobacteria bacterium RIFOXYD12_FULL_57_12]